MIKQPAAPVQQVLNYEHCITARVDTLLTDGVECPQLCRLTGWHATRLG